MAEQISHNLFDDDDNNNIADDDNGNGKPEFTSDGVLYDIGLLPSFAQDPDGNLFLLSHSDGHIFRLRTADVNYDGTIDAQDIDSLAAEAQKPPASRSKWFDLNNDGVVNFSYNTTGTASDSDYLIREVLDTKYGDANLDGEVDVVDFDLLSQGIVANGAKTGWKFGDFNGMGGPGPDVVDFDIFAQNYLSGSGASLAAESFRTPELGTAALAALAMLVSAALPRHPRCQH
jgi:hypothetical protein